MGQVRSPCANLLQQVHHLSRTTIIIHCSSTATSHCYFCLESSYTSFILHIALHFSIHVLMFGSATFLTPQYWVSQPNKHTQEPHHQRKFWDLFVTSSLPSTSTSVSATSLLPLLHLHTSFCSKNTLVLCMELLKRTDEGTKFQSAAVAPMSDANCAGDGEGLLSLVFLLRQGVIAFNYHQNHHLSCFIEYYNRLCVPLPSATPSEIRIQGNCR